jgi:hypothetical protein
LKRQWHKRLQEGRDKKTTAALCANAHGFSLHTTVRCGAGEPRLGDRAMAALEKVVCLFKVDSGHTIKSLPANARV